MKNMNNLLCIDDNIRLDSDFRCSNCQRKYLVIDGVPYISEIKIADLLDIKKRQLKQHLYKVAYSNVITRIVGKGILKLLRASKNNEKEN
jgi:transposase-like protein